MNLAIVVTWIYARILSKFIISLLTGLFVGRGQGWWEREARREGGRTGRTLIIQTVMHTVIRECGSTLYVGLSRFPHRANTNHFRCNLLAGEF